MEGERQCANVLLEVTRMEKKNQADLDSAANLRELWEDGLPAELLEELEQSKALFPGSECLQPHELARLQHLPQERMTHARDCAYCSGLTERASLDPEKARTLVAQAFAVAEKERAAANVR